MKSIVLHEFKCEYWNLLGCKVSPGEETGRRHTYPSRSIHKVKTWHVFPQKPKTLVFEVSAPMTLDVLPSWEEYSPS